MSMTPEEIQTTERQIVDVLKNIYDLGLVYEIDYTPDGVANIRMTLTAPNCPMADYLVEEVHTQVMKVRGVKEVIVEIVFEPPWDKEMMSEEALMALGML